jgi:hypothetical protein
MFRRAAAGVILGISLFVASLGWASFIALRTVFDPDRSQQIANDLWEDEAVKAQLADNIGIAVTALLPEQLPEGVEITDELVSAVSLVVLESPALRSVVAAAFVQTHAAFLGEADLPRAVEVGEISQTVRNALVSLDPSLESVVPAAPDVSIELPTDRIPNAGPLRRALQFIVPIFATIAAVGVVVALLTTTSRPRVLRRAGVWALTSSAFVLVVSYGVPWLVGRLAPSQAEVLAAFVQAVLRAAITPSVVLASLGVIAIVVSFLWRAGQAVRSDGARVPATAPASAPAPPPTEAVPSARSSARRGGASNVVHMPQVTVPTAATPSVPAPPAPATPMPRRPAPAAAPVEPPAVPDPTSVAAAGRTESAPLGDTPPIGNSEQGPTRGFAANGEGLAPRWVDGVGWVQHTDDTRPPDGARWEPGIGYILDRPNDPLAE